MANTILDKLGTRISNEIKAIKNQLLTISSGSIPSGIVLPFTGLVAPLGFLLCHGQEVNRTTYANLFAVLGTSHGHGDGLSTFNLPDYRGVFLRGADLGKGLDPDAPSRQPSATGGNAGDNIGSYQSNAIEDHAHLYNAYSENTSLKGIQSLDGVSNNLNPNYKTKGITPSESNPNIVISNDTRPKNISVNYIIKF
jgi:microcystin-dependent protein